MFAFGAMLLVIQSVMLGAVLLVVVPKYGEIFSDFGVRLPEAVKAVLRFSAWFRGAGVGQTIPGWAVLAPVWVVGVGALLGLGLMPRQRKVAAVVCLLLFLVLFTVTTAIFGGLYLQTLSLTESLQGGKL